LPSGAFSEDAQGMQGEQGEQDAQGIQVPHEAGNLTELLNSVGSSPADNEYDPTQPEDPTKDLEKSFPNFPVLKDNPNIVRLQSLEPKKWSRVSSPIVVFKWSSASEVAKLADTVDQSKIEYLLTVKYVQDFDRRVIYTFDIEKESKKEFTVVGRNWARVEVPLYCRGDVCRYYWEVEAKEKLPVKLDDGTIAEKSFQSFINFVEVGPEPKRDSRAEKEFKLLEWNVFLLPYIILVRNDNQEARAPWIAETLRKHPFSGEYLKADVLVMCETFDDDAREILMRKL
jgi:hypothetical protein